MRVICCCARRRWAKVSPVKGDGFKATGQGITSPPGLVAAQSVTDDMRERQRSRPEDWALPFEQWDAIISHCQQCPLYKELKQCSKGGIVSMYDICTHFVVPWTRGTGCSLATLTNPEGPKTARLMVCHAWGEDVEECQEALRECFTNGNIPVATPIWCCAFALYQAEDTFGPSIQEQLGLEPMKKVIHSSLLKAANAGFGLAVVHASQQELYRRLWCVYEVDEAISADDVSPRAALSAKYTEAVNHRIDELCEGGRSEADALRGAADPISSVGARCGNQRDEKAIVAEVYERGGFSRLDEVVSGFRQRKVLPAVRAAAAPSLATLLDLPPPPPQIRQTSGDSVLPVRRESQRSQKSRTSQRSRRDSQGSLPSLARREAAHERELKDLFQRPRAPDIPRLMKIIRDASESSEHREGAITAIGNLAVLSRGNPYALREEGAIPLLVQMLESANSDQGTKSTAMKALARIALNGFAPELCGDIRKAGAIPLTIVLVANGSSDEKEGACWLLYVLAQQGLAFCDEIEEAGGVRHLERLRDKGGDKHKNSASRVLFELQKRRRPKPGKH